MTVEERLQELILARYRSLREFAMTIDMSPSTLDSMLKRGLDRATIGNVIKVCNALHISIDELANGRIISTVSLVTTDSRDVDNILRILRGDILTRDDLTLNGQALTDVDRIALSNLLDAVILYDHDKYTEAQSRLKRYYEELNTESQ